MKTPPRSRPASSVALAQRLVRDAAAVPAPSPHLRPRILRALCEERARSDPAATSPPATSVRAAARLALAAAAALVLLLLWDPSHLSGTRPSPVPPTGVVASRWLAGRLLGWSEAAPLVGGMDRPLRREMDRLVADTTRVAAGITASLSDSPFARLLAAGERGSARR